MKENTCIVTNISILVLSSSIQKMEIKHQQHLNCVSHPQRGVPHALSWMKETMKMPSVIFTQLHKLSYSGISVL